MLVYYVTEEGGLWTPLVLPSLLDQTDVVAQLTVFRSEHKRTSAIMVDDKRIDAYAVLFPSSDVWDWYHRGIRQPGRPGYYEEVKEIIDGDTKS